MFIIEQAKRLPYAMPGDIVEVVVSNNKVQLVHKGIEHKQTSQDKIGQLHSWQVSFHINELESIRIEPLTKPAGLLSRLFGKGSKGATNPESAHLYLEIKLG